MQKGSRRALLRKRMIALYAVGLKSGGDPERLSATSLWRDRKLRPSSNTVNAARSTYGLDCPRTVVLDPPVRLRARFSSSGRAAGRVEELDSLLDCLCRYRDEYDAVALSSVIDVPGTYHREYFERAGKMVNPWGGVEAMLTHAVSSLLDVPSAHAPMFESREIANMDPGVVDPRMAAEAVSVTFLQCVLKGLQRSPRIVSGPRELASRGTLTAGDISCIIIPDGCLGLPTLAALEQGITVIAVRENRNLMKNDLAALPWRPGQFRRVENYWEAAGVMAALRAGIDPFSLRRPLNPVRVTNVSSVVQSKSTEVTTESLELASGLQNNDCRSLRPDGRHS